MTEFSAFSLDGNSYKIDEDIHDASKVSDDSCWGEEESVCHYLQIEFDAHKNHKHILSNLKDKKQVELKLSNHTLTHIQLSNLASVPEAWEHA